MRIKKFIANKYFFVSVISLLSFFVLLIFINSPGINGYQRAMVPEMIYGTAWKPFVYRTLLPSTVRAVAEVTPSSIKNTFEEFATEENFIGSVFTKLGWESKYAYEYFILNGFMYLFLIGFAFAFRILMKNIFSTEDWVYNITTFLSILALPTMFKYYNYVYDFPTLFFFTLGLIFLYKKKWKLFLIVYFLACINKETTFLLTLIFCIYYLKQERLLRKEYYKLLFIQLLIFLIVKASLFFIFANNAGGIVEFHIQDHNWKIINGYSPVDFLILLGLIIFILHNWNEKPEFLKTSLWILLPLVLLSTFLGFLDELRDYYEAYPVVFLLLSFSAIKILGRQIQAKPTEINQAKVV